MSVLSRTLPTIRLSSGGIVVLLIGVLASFGIGTVASAEPAQQAATATTTPGPTAVGAAPSTCASTPEGIVLSLDNPQPGDTLLSGVPINMSGIAYDTASTSSSGISSVALYLGDRDAGGLSLGTALLGQPNPQASADSQFATAGFKVRTPSLPSGSGGRTVFVYARSSITNAERVLQVPVYLNTAPTPVKGQVPTAVLPAPPACTPTPAPTAVPTATTPPAPASTVAAAVPTLPKLPTLAPLPTLALPAPGPAAPPAAAPAAPAVAPAPAAAQAPAGAQATAPRGGGIPSEVGLGLVTAGALLVGGGLAWRRRRRRILAEAGDSASGS